MQAQAATNNTKAPVKANGNKNGNHGKGKPAAKPIATNHTNKRATDHDVPVQAPEQQAPEAADKALAAAAQALHDGVQIEADVPRIVVRQDVRGHHFVFFVDSEDKAAKSIQMYDVSKGVAEKEVVNVEFYKHTKPVEDAKVRDKVVSNVIKTFDVPRVILRSRLVKEGSLNRDEEGKLSTLDIDKFKERLIAAITKAIREA